MRFLPLVFFVLVVTGCQNSTEKTENKPTFVSESILVDDAAFAFQHDSIPLILESLGLCVLDDTSKPNDTIPPCNFNLFRYFANQHEPYKNGFLVEIKPGVWSKFFLVVNIAKNMDGEYYKSNAFHGQLLEMRTTQSGPHDLIIRYIDADVGTVAILHKWNKTKYDPVDVVEINDHFVKPEKKDSLNNVYLKNFVWGY